VAPNKLLAKMASEFNKPNGISIVHETEVQGLIWPLNVRKINGIGPKAGEKLARLEIQTIGQLAEQDRQWLMANFGKSTGAWMHEVAWGRDDSPITLESEPVSISRETTFDRDLHAVRDRQALGEIFTELCNKLAGDLQRKGYVAKTIGIKLRYDDFRIATRDHTAQGHTADARLIRQLAGLCLKRVPLDKRLRLLGVRASALAKAGTSPALEAKMRLVQSKRAEPAIKTIVTDQQLF
ncbi:MAG: DNA polymerase IV, partial [Polaromonas sp.]